MLNTQDIIRKSLSYIALIIGLTVLFVGIALISQEFVTSIATHNTQIIIIALFVLVLAIVFQYKQAGIAVDNARLYKALEEKQTALDRDLKMARSVQQGLIPNKIPNLQGSSLAVRCLPAANIGGDFFDFIEKEYCVDIVLGDVSGHGVSSALVMALTHGVINEIGQKYSSPQKILEEANHHIQSCLENNINFVTVFYASFNPHTKELTYARGGHLPALLYTKGSKEPQLLDPEGTVLGVFPEALFTEAHIQLQSGDTVVFYTDGLTEVQNTAGEWFGDPRLIQLLGENISLAAQELLDSVYLATQNFSSLQRDDQTMIILKVA